MISFVLSAEGEPELTGELVISAEMARATARELGADPLAELYLYTVHGLLHLCGYDDLTGGNVRMMRDRESQAPAATGTDEHLSPGGADPGRPATKGASGVVGLTSMRDAGPGASALVVHLVSIALTKALQSYSRSRLEEYCSDRGRPERADEVAHLDEQPSEGPRRSQSAPGSFWPRLAAWTLEQWHSPASLELAVLLVLLVVGLGYLVAGVVGKVFAEPILYAFWPAASLLRGSQAAHPRRDPGWSICSRG